MTRLLLATALAGAVLVPTAASARDTAACPLVRLYDCPDGCREIFRERNVVMCVEQH